MGFDETRYFTISHAKVYCGVDGENTEPND